MKAKNILSAEDMAYLVSESKKLKRLLTVSEEGVKPNIVFGLNGRLFNMQLVKIEFSVTNRDEISKQAEELARKTDSTIVHISGNEVVFFKKHPQRMVRDIGMRRRT